MVAECRPDLTEQAVLEICLKFQGNHGKVIEKTLPAEIVLGFVPFGGKKYTRSAHSLDISFLCSVLSFQSLNENHQDH